MGKDEVGNSALYLKDAWWAAVCCMLLDILHHNSSQLQLAGKPEGVRASSMTGKQITEEHMRALCRERTPLSSDACIANNGMPCTNTHRDKELSGGVHWLRLSLCNKFQVDTRITLQNLQRRLASISCGPQPSACPGSDSMGLYRVPAIGTVTMII